jgi:hypothetical protein
MPNVTLILTRTPLDEFILMGGQHKDDVDELSDDERLRLYLPRNAPLTDQKPSIERPSGRWGSMLLIRGPEITAASFAVAGTAAGGGSPVLLNGRPLALTTGGGAITKTVEFTTLERYRGNLGGMKTRYVMMPARAEPYPLKVERGNRVVKTLIRDKDKNPVHSGDCIRVYGGETKAQRGILIHEAPNVSWVIGCIGPRTKGDRKAYQPSNRNNPSAKAMKIILEEMTIFGQGKGRLFVLP